MLPGTISVTGGRIRDPYFANVALLLHGNGANGAGIVDSSSNAFSIVAGGDAACRTAVSKFGGASIGLDGTGDWLVADSTFAAPGSGDMTIEAWVYPTNGAKQQCVMDFRLQNGDYEPRIDFDNTFDGGNNDGFVFFVGNAARAATTTLALNTWYHLAVSRNGGVWRFFLNGAQVGSDFSLTTNMTRRKLSLGTYWDARGTNASYKFQGYVDDFRLTIGVGRYAANFTPPASQYPDG
ncbi:hypothetical protein ASC89_27255 [Devosia sp. Root413D1]|uniref:LamG domain-containing protein n=1 Tax=unclassified Devosia TaxID=196773 RepID=UPI0006F7D35E|nr:LamG domain-containing protein [Devosia sp. Root413D1]KQW74101.1 hypothetical protein ASC89_27255 [Devosia sp. Root413D1]